MIVMAANPVTKPISIMNIKGIRYSPPLLKEELNQSFLSSYSPFYKL